MKELLKFVELTQEFKAIKRRIVFSNDDREENDAEHSYQLALVAWYLINKDSLNLNIELAVKYALIHDLVEVYAGDTPAALHKGFEDEQNTKHEREEQAAKLLKEKFPEFYELHSLIQNYEEKADEEARFVNALDKILPVLSVYLDGGYSWKTHDISFEDLIQNKTERIALSPVVRKYFEEMVELLKENKQNLFK